MVTGGVSVLRNGTGDKQEGPQNLDELNNEIAQALFPVLVVIVFLMVIGIIGNVLMILFCRFQNKLSTTICFIMCLAAFDITTCAITMPLEIIDLNFYYTYPSKTLCIITRFVNYFGVTGSDLLLVAIAAERYRKICLPFENQLSIGKSKVVIIMCVLVSVILACPSIFLNSVAKVKIKTANLDIYAYECTTRTESSYSTFLLAYYIAQCSIFTISITILSVVYILIGRALQKHKSVMSAITKHVPDDNTSNATEVVALRHSCKISQIKIQSTCTDSIKPGVFESLEENNEPITKNKVLDSDDVIGAANQYALVEDCGDGCSTNDSFESLRKNNGALTKRIVSDSDGVIEAANDFPLVKDRESGCSTKDCGLTSHVIVPRKKSLVETQKHTALLFSITVAYIVSFLPYLCLSVKRKFFDKDGVVMSTSELITYNFVIRSYFLNGVVNPFIYGFFNSAFRQFVKSVMHKYILCR